ncbi:MAG: pyridoxamine 5'-phosphate oxidase family protein [Bacteroidales bacterium]|nr:pyridoxamine 5'-phosphate oxidase family protein [Bacteroidales bacterium]
MKRVFTLLIIAATALGFESCCGEENEQNAQKETIASEYQTNNTENMEEVYQFLKDCETYYLATVDGDRPRVRPFGTVNIFEGKLYIQTGKKKRTAQQLALNPHAEICAFNGNSWIRVETTLVPDERVEAKKSMLDSYPQLRAMYDENDDNTIVYFMTDSRAWITSFGAPEKEIEF